MRGDECDLQYTDCNNPFKQDDVFLTTKEFIVQDAVTITTTMNKDERMIEEEIAGYLFSEFRQIVNETNSRYIRTPEASEIPGMLLNWIRNWFGRNKKETMKNMNDQNMILQNRIFKVFKRFVKVKNVDVSEGELNSYITQIIEYVIVNGHITHENEKIQETTGFFGRYFNDNFNYNIMGSYLLENFFSRQKLLDQIHLTPRLFELLFKTFLTGIKIAQKWMAKTTFQKNEFVNFTAGSIYWENRVKTDDSDLDRISSILSYVRFCIIEMYLRSTKKYLTNGENFLDSSSENLQKFMVKSKKIGYQENSDIRSRAEKCTNDAQLKKVVMDYLNEKKYTKRVFLEDMVHRMRKKHCVNLMTMSR